MNKFSVDYQKLEGKLEYKKAYKLSEVQDKVRKVAFDVVRFIDSDNIEGLWQIQHGADGDYIVAMYGDGPEENVKSSSNWGVVSDKSSGNFSIFYKGTPIARLALSSLGIPKEDSSLIVSYLPDRLAENPRLVSGLLQELTVEERQELLTKYPELK